MMQKNDYLITFMDINMPIKNGDIATFEFRQWQQEHKKNNSNYIVALSATIGDDQKNNLLRQGFNQVLQKPVTKQNIDDILKISEYKI